MLRHCWLPWQLASSRSRVYLGPPNPWIARVWLLWDRLHRARWKRWTSSICDHQICFFRSLWRRLYQTDCQVGVSLAQSPNRNWPYKVGHTWRQNWHECASPLWPQKSHCSGPQWNHRKLSSIEKHAESGAQFGTIKSDWYRDCGPFDWLRTWQGV